MPVLSGVFRLGRDAQKITAEGQGHFYSLSLAYDVFTNGQQVTQWLSAVLGHQLGDKLAPYLVKGTSIEATADGLHLHEIPSRQPDEPKRTIMKARLVGAVTLVSRPRVDDTSAPQEPAAE